jgi:hypothetical protein
MLDAKKFGAFILATLGTSVRARVYGARVRIRERGHTNDYDSPAAGDVPSSAAQARAAAAEAFR